MYLLNIFLANYIHDYIKNGTHKKLKLELILIPVGKIDFNITD